MSANPYVVYISWCRPTCIKCPLSLSACPYIVGIVDYYGCSNQLNLMPFLMRLAAMIMLGVTILAHEITVSLPKIFLNDLIEVMDQETDRHAIKSRNSKKDKSEVTFTVSTSFKEGVESLISNAITATR